MKHTLCVSTLYNTVFLSLLLFWGNTAIMATPNLECTNLVSGWTLHRLYSKLCYEAEWLKNCAVTKIQWSSLVSQTLLKGNVYNLMIRNTVVQNEIVINSLPVCLSSFTNPYVILMTFFSTAEHKILTESLGCFQYNWLWMGCQALKRQKHTMKVL